MRSVILARDAPCGPARPLRIPHALIGGLALAAHGAGRATAGLDLLADGDRAEDVDRILRELGYERLLRNPYVGNYLGSTPERRRVAATTAIAELAIAGALV